MSEFWEIFCNGEGDSESDKIVGMFDECSLNMNVVVFASELSFIIHNHADAISLKTEDWNLYSNRTPTPCDTSPAMHVLPMCAATSDKCHSGSGCRSLSMLFYNFRFALGFEERTQKNCLNFYIFCSI